MKPPILLRVYKNDTLEGVRQFEPGQVVIGREADVQLDLGHKDISNLHCVIEERDTGFYLSDLGSQTGTFVNGKKILDQKLESGDEIKVGPYRLQFFIGVPKPVSPPAHPPTRPADGDAVKREPLTKKMSGKKPAKDVQPPPVPKIPADVPVVREDSKTSVTSAKSTPKAVAQVRAAKKDKSHKTFAPPSVFNDAKEIVKPSKGTVVEVLVAWKERIIAARHFHARGDVTVGSHPDSDLIVPVFSAGARYSLVRIHSMASVALSPDMPGELINDQGSTPFAELFKRNLVRKTATGYELDIPQGEMVRIGFQGNLISVFVRYVPETPKPLVAPLLDFTTSEVTGVILAGVVAAIFGLYMLIYAPSDLVNEARLEEPLRKAVVTFNIPKAKDVVIVEEKPPAVEKKVVQIVDKKRESTRPAVESPGKPGAAGEVAPKVSKDKEKKVTSAKPGGAIKTAPKEGASAKSAAPDPTRVGLLGVFGSKGAQKNLDKAFSGSGELQGLAQGATGFAGNADSRPGDDLGTKLKDTGAGGKGTSTVGIAGVGTKGRGTGNYGYGTGGIGTKGSVDIDVGGQEAEFAGSIDREAIRRIIQANKSAIRSCYERSLQRKPDLYGKLVLEWDIEEKGRVTRTSVKSNDLGDAQVASCILARIKSLRFPEPPPDQIGRVTFPFVFSSQ